MRFERESWRKLYVVESVEHRLLPLFTRSVRDYLLRVASDDGTLLKSTKTPAADLARVLTAEPAEKKQLERAVEQLIAIEYLTLSRGRLTITKFVEAQAAKSPGAKRQQRYRDVHKNGSGDVPGNATEASLGDVTNNVTSDETRRDETTPVGLVVTPAGDPDRESMCPADLRDRAETAGIFPELAKALHVDEEALREETRRFVGYWTIGDGAGKKRRHWMGKLRQRLVDRAQEGALPKKTGNDYGPVEDWVTP